MPQKHEEALCALALGKPAAKRAAFLDAMCEGDAALRQRLEALLAAHEHTDAAPATAAPAARATIKLDLTDAPDEAVGQTLGRYKLLERVGEGGCGVVYVAEQTQPVRRRVALKVIKLGMDTKQVVARFEAERQALAMMDHPNIAKVLDAGTTELGRPYFVMELVRGIRITDYCDQNQLSTKERLDLFIKVCQAIQHAHQKGIVHRDIKPSNILVTLHDGVPVPKVIDFGIAKATEGRLTDATVYTQLHQFIGTPAYMSPEQAEMSGLDIDTRSDIYSLGVLLYELLAGSTPFDAKELMASGIDQMRKTIRELEPVRPSTRFATLKGEDLTTTAKRRSADKSNLMHDLKGDLDWIVMKCLEKDRTRRYDTATGLAADLKRHLNNEPVLARPPSTVYKFQKAFRRNKLVFAAGTAIAAALVLGLIGTSLGLVRAEQQRRTAEISRKLAEQRFQSASRFVEDVFQKVAPEFSELIGATKARETLAQTSVSFLEKLGESGGSDESFKLELATLYGQLASALGNPFAANSIGDYESALKFANQSLAILQALQLQHPGDAALQAKIAWTHDAVGSILHASQRPDEAMIHFQRSLELFRQLSDQHPADTAAKMRVQVANFRIGHVLLDQGHASEALEQHYLPYGKSWLDRAVDSSLDSRDAHWCYVAHQAVGQAEMQLDQPAKALLQFELARRCTKILVEREPNEARYARDWSTTYSHIGTALIALGRYDEGMTNLQAAVQVAESIVARDPMNGSSQYMLIEELQQLAKGAATAARVPDLAPARQKELWQQVIQSLTRGQERLASPELAQMKFPVHPPEGDATEKIVEARNALAQLASGAETKPVTPNTSPSGVSEVKE